MATVKTQNARKATSKLGKASKDTPVFSVIAYAAQAIQTRLDAHKADKAKPSFYHSAFTYHRKHGTAFPRPRHDAPRIELCAMESGKAKQAIDDVMQQHDKFILAPGSTAGQVCFDLYMMHTK